MQTGKIMIYAEKNKIILTGGHAFSPEQTFLCGQCFRFDVCSDGSFFGVAGGRGIRVLQNGEKTELFCDEKDFKSFWRAYFDLDRDYGGIPALVSDDDFLKTAAEYGGGIRILNQQPWEALCSFIISQCNNIPRIKGIIKRMCSLFGEKNNCGYGFPEPESIAKLDADELALLRAGYRAPYLLAAARAVASGALDLEGLKNRETPTGTVREELMRLPGVGRKVADCVMLYGLGRTESFPIDVWMKRALKCYYPDGFDASAYGENAGIIQQYIFYYAREHGCVF